MKVLLVVHGLPPAASGGTELHAEAHARILVREHGDQVLVVAREQDARRPEYALRTERRDGYSVTFVNNTFAATRRFSQAYANPDIDEVVGQVIDGFAPDVAHLHHLTCLSTGIVEHVHQRAVRTLLSLHDYWMLCHRGQLFDLGLRACDGPDGGCRQCVPAASAIAPARRLAKAVASRAGRWWPGIATRAAAVARRHDGEEGDATLQRQRHEHMRHILSLVSRAFAPSRFIRDRFVAAGMDPARITLAPYGIEPTRPPAPTAPLTGGPLRVGYAGSLMVSKGAHVLVDAVAPLAPGRACLDLFGAYAPYHGDDTYGRVVASWRGRPGLRLHGGWPHDRMVEAFAAMDVLVVPSLWPENSPFVVHEAFAAGVPVIASRVGGLPELVRDGENGLLVPPGDASALTRALARLADEPGLVDHLRRGIGPAHPLAENVSFMRGFYEDDRDQP